ncbi:MAG: sulfite exporter TauE/SafE family protein [Phycisphaerales bacterium]
MRNARWTGPAFLPEEIRLIWAWLGAAAVGLSLGLLGSGGAILTVPILVYLVGHDEKSAIAESLAIVGAIALVGAARAAGQGRVDFRSAALLAIPGVLGTYLGASAARFIPGSVQLLLLAVLMLTASGLMFRGEKTNPGKNVENAPDQTGRSGLVATGLVAAQGVGLGVVTGLVGVGGGFLIVPVLVLLRRVPMPTAIGTSLAIIAVNSTSGLLKYMWVLDGMAKLGSSTPRVNWSIVLVFSAVGIAGSLVGNLLSGRIDPRTLKRMFAFFLVVMAGYIVVRQAPHVFPGVFGTRAAQSARELEPRSGGVAPTEDNPLDYRSPLCALTGAVPRSNPCPQ